MMINDDVNELQQEINKNKEIIIKYKGLDEELKEIQKLFEEKCNEYKEIIDYKNKLSLKITEI